MPPPPTIPAARIVVLMPNWLGDAVMATPFLRALRGLYPEAHIAAAAIPLVAPVLAGLPFVSETHVHAKKESPAAWLRAGRFDLGILLPNSFRSAWNLFRGRVPRRLGYARDRRSFLLTDRVEPQPLSAERWRADMERELAIAEMAHKQVSIGSAFEPLPTIDYYLELARRLGAETPSRRMELGITGAERAEADAALAQIDNPQSPIGNAVLLVPGANFGSSKCWQPERFAAVAEKLADPSGVFHATVLIATSPAERPIADAILAGVTAFKERVHALGALNSSAGVSVGALKEISRRARLMICNDTGPRHFAAAFGVPTVTLFGPTDPVWAETYSPRETVLRIRVPCGPCQLKQCPIDHRCMTGITVEMVLAAAAKRLADAAASPKPA